MAAIKPAFHLPSARIRNPLVPELPRSGNLRNGRRELAELEQVCVRLPRPRVSEDSV